MKIVTLLGTRPELIRLSRIIPKLDEIIPKNHIFIHTNQNADPNLKDIFFEDLEIRPPDYFLNAKGSFAEQEAIIFGSIGDILRKEKPDKLLILGDTNSALGAIVAKKMGIPVYHMEAGNRCFDDRVPEETNRRILDHISDVHLPYTERSKQNLLREGIRPDRILVTGNPIYEVLTYYQSQISKSKILKELKLKPKNFFLVTLHRSENVDYPDRLSDFIDALENVQVDYNFPIIVSTHPHTRQRLETEDRHITEKIQFLPPFGFFDFITLEKNAVCMLTDCLHPKSLIMTSEGIIKEIQELQKNEKIISGNKNEIINHIERKNIEKKYKIKTIYNEIICSENHRLFVFDKNNDIKETKAKDIKKNNHLVSFCKINPSSKDNISLIQIQQPFYLKIDEIGRKIIKEEAKKDNLSQFGRIKSNVIYNKKGIEILKLKNVLKYLNINFADFEKYLYEEKNIHQRQIHINQPKILNEDLSEFVGYFNGDGCICNYRTGIYDEKTEVLNYFIDKINSLFGIKGNIKKDNRGNGCSVNFHSKSLADFIKTNFKKETQKLIQKDISDTIITANNDILSAYIRGLFEAEGCVYDHSIGISMASEKIIRKLKILLLRFGIISNFYYFPPKRTRDKSMIYALHIFETESKKLFKEHINFISTYKKEKLEKMLSQHKQKDRSRRRIDNFFKDRVVDITEIVDKEKYYDLNVSPTNTFFVNGILSHNSGTCQEECCILKVPSVILRDTTERPETIECGSSIISGASVDGIQEAVEIALRKTYDWSQPEGYLEINVSDKIIKIIYSFLL